jgi:WD40 repeat protein
VTADVDGTARLWDAASGQQLAVLEGHHAAVNSVIFDRQGARLLTASDDGTASLWDAASGKELAILYDAGKMVSAVFDLEGARVLTASAKGTARVWKEALTMGPTSRSPGAEAGKAGEVQDHLAWVSAVPCPSTRSR